MKNYALEFKNVSVIYGEGSPFRKAALNNITTSFPKGEITGIIGHTGSGKSTLASLTNGLLKPTSGEILLDGENIWAKPKELIKIRSRVGLVFQYPEYQLFDETVEEDIAFGPKNMKLPDEEIKSRVRLAAEFCGAGAENFRFGSKLYMNLKTDDRFVSHNHSPPLLFYQLKKATLGEGLANQLNTACHNSRKSRY